MLLNQILLFVAKRFSPEVFPMYFWINAAHEQKGLMLNCCFGISTELSMSMVWNRWKTISRWQTITQLRAPSNGLDIVKPFERDLQIEPKRANSGLPKSRFSSKFGATEIMRFQQAGLWTHMHFPTTQQQSKLAQNGQQITLPDDQTHSKKSFVPTVPFFWVHRGGGNDGCFQLFEPLILVFVPRGREESKECHRSFHVQSMHPSPT